MRIAFYTRAEAVLAHVHDHFFWIGMTAFATGMFLGALRYPPRYLLRTEQTVHHDQTPVVQYL